VREFATNEENRDKRCYYSNDDVSVNQSAAGSRASCISSLNLRHFRRRLADCFDFGLS